MDNVSAVESIFLAALEKVSAEDRTAYLDQACGKDAELRQRVERLLSAHPKVGSFLEAAPADKAVTTEEPRVTERPGTAIGPYRLMEKIGEGGMGLVFVAEQQQPVRRKVALKVVKPGMDTREVIARFEAERQALALMDHPNIARVLDAGATESGRPYFVMELVRGVPITDFCDQHQLTPRERLGLFISVCQAVQHAHSKGVIHRDIKPSNVLVTLHDGAPVVKVIDFGVAKAIGQSLTDKTVYTRFAQMIGTPLYMSPEQAEMAGLDVDTRCDIYALGVLLYELLTGTTPFDSRRLQKAAFDEIRRIIREEEPPKPSTRISTLGAGLSDVSARRKTEPRKLSALVKGDLDWIVMKALEKDRNRRYETASAFVADVRRYLGQEPVEARPPSTLYRFGKLARRNRVALTTAALVAAALVAGTLVSTWMAVVARRAEGTAMDATANAIKAKADSDENARVANERKGQVELLAKDFNRALYEADVELMPGAWDADDLAAFDQFLDRHATPPEVGDPRNFEWYYWYRQRHGEQRSIPLAGGFHEFQSPRFSPDGRLFAAIARVAARGEIRLWDVATGEARRTLLTIPDYGEGFQTTPAQIVFSPDGGRLALAQMSFGKEMDPVQMLYRNPEVIHLDVRVWDTDRGDELCRIALDCGDSRIALAFGPKGKQLALAASPAPGQPASGNVRVWDVDAGKEAYALSAPGTPRALAFSPDGGRLAVALSREGWGERIPDDKNRVQIWDTATQKELLMIPKKGTFQNGPVETTRPVVTTNGVLPPAPPSWMGSLPNGVAFSPDGMRLAVVWQGQKDDVLTLHEILKGGNVRTKEGIAKTKVVGLRLPVFSPDGRRLTCAVSGSRVQVWDTDTGVVLDAVRGHAATPAVAFTANGAHLLTAGVDGTLKEWAELAPRPRLTDLDANSNFSPLAVAFTPRGLRMARAFDTLKGDRKSLEVRSWDEKGGAFSIPVEAQLRLNKVQHLLFNQDGTRLAADFVMSESTEAKPRIGMKVWDVETGKELLAAESSSLFMGLAFSADGRRVAWVGQGRARVWDVNSGKLLLDVPESWSMPIYATFSADGSRLAWAGDRRVRVWDVDPAREVLTVAGGYAGALTLSPDGTLLAGVVGSLRAMEELKVWNVADGRVLMNPKSQRSVQDLAFSPDGSRLALFRWKNDQEGNRGVVTLWDPSAGRPLLQLGVPAGLRSNGLLRFQPDGRKLYLFNTYPHTGSDTYEVWDGTPVG